MDPSIISAASGLSGVVLGGLITWWREDAREKTRAKKETSYLAILVAAHLDQFADACVSVAHDDGTSEGRPAGEDGFCYEVTVIPPEFAPLNLDVDWRVLPSDLMYGILNLPHKIEKLDAKIEARWDDPPEYTDAFWTRQQGYAELGLAASDLAQRLRRHAGLPIEKPEHGEWNRDESLREQRNTVATARADYEARIAKAPSLID